MSGFESLIGGLGVEGEMSACLRLSSVSLSSPQQHLSWQQLPLGLHRAGMFSIAAAACTAFSSILYLGSSWSSLQDSQAFLLRRARPPPSMWYSNHAENHTALFCSCSRW